MQQDKDNIPVPLEQIGDDPTLNEDEINRLCSLPGGRVAIAIRRVRGEIENPATGEVSTYRDENFQVKPTHERFPTYVLRNIQPDGSPWGKPFVCTVIWKKPVVSPNQCDTSKGLCGMCLHRGSGRCMIGGGAAIPDDDDLTSLR